MRAGEKCGHGLPLSRDTYCPACEILWHETCLADAQKAVSRHQLHLDRARATIEPKEQADG
jgi:hypothetical protein